MKAFIPASEKRVDEYSRTQRSSEDGTERVNTPRLAAHSNEVSAQYLASLLRGSLFLKR